MNKYELSLVITANIDEQARTAEIEKIHELITKFGGTIDKFDDWGRRRLAYPIKKQSDAFYSFTYFSAPAEAPAELEQRLRIIEPVLRFLIVRPE